MDVLGIVEAILIWGLAIVCGLLFTKVDALKHQHKHLVREFIRQDKELMQLVGKAPWESQRDRRQINIWTVKLGEDKADGEHAGPEQPS